MINHSYISLDVPKDLTKEQAILLYKTINEHAPDGICVSTEIPPHNKAVRFYTESHNGHKKYIVSLSRDLLSEEVQKIAVALDRALPEIDFEINWSQRPEPVGKTVALKENTLKAVILEASKRAHNSWVNSKVNEGWRYGQKINPIEKTSPLCVQWENLAETYRKNEYRRMLGLINVLNEMGMIITKK